MIEIRQLRHFIAVVDEGGFRSAARKIHLSAPALTRSLNLLEEFYGTKLLERTRSRVAPTAIGRQLLRHARIVVNELDAIPDHLGKMAGFVGGRLRVGISPVVMDLCIQPVLARIQRNYPKLKCSLTIERAGPLLTDLEQGDLDLVICVERPMEIRGNLEIHALYDERAYWWVRADHPIASHDEAPIRAFLDYPFCAQRLPPPFSEWMDDLAIRVRRETGESIDTSPSLECANYAILVRTILETDSMALIPARNAVAEERAGLLKRLAFSADTPLFPPFRMSVGYPSSLSPAPAASLFIDLLREQLLEIDAELKSNGLDDLLLAAGRPA